MAIRVVASFFAILASLAAGPPIQFVTVDNDVRLEVLDWGGSGRPLVLLAGLGNTAHVFDDFAPKLTGEFHVYGITRRGYGASSAPASGYDADRLADDVVAVLDALKLREPVLVGHSVSGQELSSIGSRHAGRIAGLVYLDAGYRYAYDEPRPDLWKSLDALQQSLSELQKHTAAANPRDNPKLLVHELLEKKLPEFQKELQAFLTYLPDDGLPDPLDFTPPAPSDLASFAALRSWYGRVRGFMPPETELRQTRRATGDGRVGEPRTPVRVPRAIQAGARRHGPIRVPVLAIFAVPHAIGPSVNMSDPAVRAVAEKYLATEAASTGAQADAFARAVPNARVVRIARANHYIFISNESQVLTELRAFLSTLQ